MAILEKGRIRAALRGHVIVPMISPLTPSGKPDLTATFRVADHIIGGGCQGLLVGGTNSEGPLLALAHRIAQIEAVVEHIAGHGMVYAGIGATAFDDAVELGRASLRSGAVAVVAHPPPCFIINTAEIEAYYLKLIDAVDGPFFIYNMPLTTGISIPLDVIGRLSTHPLVMGIKDSEGDAERQALLAAMHKDRADFTVFCGAMAHSARSLAAGADGNVPSAGNLDPAACRQLVDLSLSSAVVPSALAVAQDRVAAVSKVYQEGRKLPAQISALKGCASLLGLCSPDMLPPLLTTTDTERFELRQRLVRLHLPVS
ncbi:dihydrodipicolinate synthase family protein [Termitidicoccus mucosus]|uniref:Dihydrodipicolinate synthase family protein n=1 Tax=Termitidicoccus mucosus TaxID=1184151 RepID=A0A178IMG7_9BACT|nr:hypothetical protein AW736_05580 [Opitutaceae bacterium TSB47]